MYKLILLLLYCATCGLSVSGVAKLTIGGITIYKPRTAITLNLKRMGWSVEKAREMGASNLELNPVTKTWTIIGYLLQDNSTTHCYYIPAKKDKILCVNVPWNAVQLGIGKIDNSYNQTVSRSYETARIRQRILLMRILNNFCSDVF